MSSLRARHNRKRRVIESDDESSEGEYEFMDDDSDISEDDIEDHLFYLQLNNDHENGVKRFHRLPTNDYEQCQQWLNADCPINYERGFYKDVIWGTGLNFLLTFNGNRLLRPLPDSSYVQHELIEHGDCCLCGRNRSLSHYIFNGDNLLGSAGPDCTLKMRLALLYFEIINYIKSVKHNFSQKELIGHILSIIRTLRNERRNVENIILKRYAERLYNKRPYIFDEYHIDFKLPLSLSSLPSSY